MIKASPIVASANRPIGITCTTVEFASTMKIIGVGAECVYNRLFLYVRRV